MQPTRQQQLRRAFFRGADLQMNQPDYREAVKTLLEELICSDIGSGDITAEALALSNERVSARILAKEEGVAAGIEEFCWLLSLKQIEVSSRVADGNEIRIGDALVEFSGGRRDLLALERVGLNLLQRMSGIATLIRRYQQRVQKRNPDASVVGTRKTPWGYLDKRAVHLSGGGTHRLGLWDAILIKNNHLALLASREEEAVEIAIDRAWLSRGKAVFVEVEVRTLDSALAAAQKFRVCREQNAECCPCVIMLDHFTSREAARVVETLRAQALLDHVLIEVSGNISDGNLEEYAESGADVLSVGSLTHSPSVLDLCQRI